MADPEARSVRRHYDALAHRYDRDSARMGLFGFRDRHYHALARELLAVEPGEHVVVLGAGTGIDVVPLAQAVGPGGQVHAVDVSRNMLDRCRAKVEAAGLENVTLHHADAAQWTWPKPVHRVLASFTLLFQARYKEVIDDAVGAVAYPGRVVVADLEFPKALAWASLPFVARFGHTHKTLARRPMEYLKKRGAVVARRRFYGGAGRMVAVTP